MHPELSHRYMELRRIQLEGEARRWARLHPGPPVLAAANRRRRPVRGWLAHRRIRRHPGAGVGLLDSCVP
jgi:hypothetical protein